MFENSSPQQPSTVPSEIIKPDQESALKPVRIVIWLLRFLATVLLIQAIAIGSVIPLELDKTGLSMLSRVGLLFFPAFWILSALLAISSSLLFFLTFKLQQITRQAMLLTIATSLTLPWIWLGAYLALKEVTPITSGYREIILFQNSLFPALIIVSFILFHTRKLFVQKPSPLSKKAWTLILAVLLIPFLLSSGYFAFAKITAQTPEQNRLEIQQKSGYKLLVPEYLPASISMHLKVREKVDKDLNIKMYSQIFDTPIFTTFEDEKLVVFDQTANTNNLELVNLVGKQKSKADFVRINLAGAKNSQAYLAKIESKNELYRLLFIHQNGYICSLASANIQTDELLKTAASIN